MSVSGKTRALALGGLVSAVALLGSQGSAWGQGSKAVAGAVPPPVAEGKAVSHGPHPGTGQLTLTLGLAVRNPEQLDGVIAAASTPGSPSYGNYLTESEYMAGYAPTNTQVGAVESWLAGEGLHVTGVTADNLLVSVKGSTAAIEHAFGVAINDYQAAGKEFHANDRAPSVPADLAVASVSGLSNFFTPVAEKACFESSCGYTGEDFRAAYDVTGTAEGETIAYTLWGKPLTTTTLEKYATASGTTALTIGAGNEQVEFKELGGASTINATVEVALDLESAHVVAPKAHHVYYLTKEPTNAELAVALNEAANNSKVKVISNSWGSEEPGTCFGYNEPTIESSLQKGAALGKTFFFSSGDYGAQHGCTYPDSSQYTLSVGGTALEVGAGSTWKREYSIANGGNCNNGVTRPSWQTGIGTPIVYGGGSCTGRVYPDVSAISCGSSETGFFGECFLEYNEGKAFIEGGTSLAAPVWAAAGAVWNHNDAAAGRPGIGFVSPLIYALANDSVTYGRDFHDIQEGSNNGFSAVKGYDEASGWGSADFHKLGNNEFGLSYSGPTQGVGEQKITPAVTLTDKETAHAISGRTVKFTLGADSCTGTTNASGVASCTMEITLAPGGYSMTAEVAADAAYVAGSSSVGFSVLEPPVFGRCLKASSTKVEGKTIYHGKFTTATCTAKSATTEGKFEWYPGLGPKTGISFEMKPLTTIKLETPGGHILACTGAAGFGSITGLQSVNLGEVWLTGCSDNGAKCTNTGFEGEVVLFLGVGGSLVWQNRSLKQVDLLIKPSGFVFSNYTCPASKVEVLLGTTGVLLPVTVNKFTNKFTDKFTESKGVQVPSTIEGGATFFFEQDRFENATEKIESNGLSATLLQKDEEKYEVNTSY